MLEGERLCPNILYIIIVNIIIVTHHAYKREYMAGNNG